MKELIGKNIKQILTNDDKDILAFITVEDEVIAYKVKGECCSRNWFECIENYDDFLKYSAYTNAQVQDIFTIELPLEININKGNGDYIRIYAEKIKFISEGHSFDLNIEYRNYSKSFFGGNYVYKPNIDISNLKPWRNIINI